MYKLGSMAVVMVLLVASVAVWSGRPTAAASHESIEISALPLPPTAPPGEHSCTEAVNPNNTGCLDGGPRGVDGARNFTWDGDHVLASVHFAGAPNTGEASVFEGGQLILVKTDGTTFSNGDGWKCLTCGVPAANKVGINDSDDNTYPEAFRDEKRVKMGANILDCGPHKIIDDSCAPGNTRIYPIKTPFPEGPDSGIMRELRLHPDNVHLGWNQLYTSRTSEPGSSEFGVFGRLVFNPLANPPGYELSNVTFMVGPDLTTSGRFFSVAGPGELRFDNPAGVIGELRGFTPDGRSALGIGSQDSFNYDIFATDLQTGQSTRLTRDPAYVDPVNISPDGGSMVVLDGRNNNRSGYPGANPPGGDGRLYFASAGIGVPPLLDLAIADAVGSLYTKPGRGGIFEPYLLELNGDAAQPVSDIDDGLQLNGGGDVAPGNGGPSDPLWNAGADPAWSPDGTAVAYYERLATLPGCGPIPPTLAAPCPVSTEPGGRLTRLMLAELTSRTPVAPPPAPPPVSDDIPWGIPYESGDDLPPLRAHVPAGQYTLKGRTGQARVVVTEGPSRFNPGETEIASVHVTYTDYSADGYNVVNGTESGIRGATYTWHSDLNFTGLHHGSRRTGPDGFVVAPSPQLGGPATFSGTMTTELDGRTYVSPVTGG